SRSTCVCCVCSSSLNSDGPDRNGARSASGTHLRMTFQIVRFLRIDGCLQISHARPMKYLLTIALCLALVFGVGAQRRIIAQQTTTTEETTTEETTTESTVDKTSKLKKKSASALIAAVQKAD